MRVRLELLYGSIHASSFVNIKRYTCKSKLIILKCCHTMYIHCIYIETDMYIYIYIPVHVVHSSLVQTPPGPTGGNSTCSLATLTRVEWGSFHPRHHSLEPGKYGKDMIGAGALWWKTLENYWNWRCSETKAPQMKRAELLLRQGRYNPVLAPSVRLHPWPIWPAPMVTKPGRVLPKWIIYI